MALASMPMSPKMAKVVCAGARVVRRDASGATGDEAEWSASSPSPNAGPMW